MVASSDESSDLVERLEALNIRGASPPPNLPPGTPKLPVTGSMRTDSGYASQSSTPDSTKGSFVDGGSTVTGSRLWPLPLRKTITLKPFDKEIPRLTQDRFEDLREEYADRLNALTRALPRCQGIIMNLKVLGENELSAVPWIYIQCDKVIARKIRSFFKEPDVRRDFEPAEPNAYYPYFRIYVCPLPPRMLGSNQSVSSSTSTSDSIAVNSITVYGDEMSITKAATFCGAEITVSSSPRSATIGGLIEILDKDRVPMLYGLTAGHFLSSQHNADVGDGGDGGDDGPCEDNKEDESALPVDLENDFSDEEDIYELDLSAFEVHKGDSLSDKVDASRGLQTTARLGTVYKASFEGAEGRPNLDWALIKIDSPGLFLPNFILGNDVRGVVSHFTKLPEEISDQMVFFSTASCKVGWARLSNSWSYIMLSPGGELVRSRVLTLAPTNGESLREGDSGTWVIDPLTHNVYGHIVASDAFGRGYVIPMDDILLDIQKRVSAKLVSVPNLYQMMDWERRIRCESNFYQEMLPPPPPPPQPAHGPPSQKSQIYGQPAMHSIYPYQGFHVPDSGYSTMNNTPAHSPPPAQGQVPLATNEDTGASGQSHIVKWLQSPKPMAIIPSQGSTRSYDSGYGSAMGSEPSSERTSPSGDF